MRVPVKVLILAAFLVLGFLLSTTKPFHGISPSSESLCPAFTEYPQSPGWIFVNSSITPWSLVGPNPLNPAAVCELFMASTKMCNIIERKNNMFDCICRFGVSIWTAVLQPQCTKSEFWNKLFHDFGGTRNTSLFHDSAGNLLNEEDFYDPVLRSHAMRSGSYESERQLRLSRARSYAQFHYPLNCSFGQVRPIGFCAPEFAFVDRVPLSHERVWDWFPVLPSFVPYHEVRKIQKVLGVRPRLPLVAADELLSWMMYRLSLFGWTHARAGPDCLRHYEHFAAGAIPLFPDLYQLDPWRMSHVPKTMLRQAFRLQGLEGIGEAPPFGTKVSTEYYYRTNAKQINFKRLGVVDRNTFNASAYDSLASEIFGFTKAHVACHAVAAYLLRSLEKESPRSLLFFNKEYIDYQSNSIEQGLYELGVNYTVAKKSQQHQTFRRSNFSVSVGEEYDAWRRAQSLDEYYGRGYFVSRRVPPPPFREPSSLCERVLEGEFDVIIYSVTELPTADIPCKMQAAQVAASNKARVAVVDGSDVPQRHLYADFVQHKFVVFSREAAC